VFCLTDYAASSSDFGRDRDSRVFPFPLTCQWCGVQENSYGNYRQHVYETGCTGYPAGCGHCGGIFPSGLLLSCHLNVRGLHRGSMAVTTVSHSLQSAPLTTNCSISSFSDVATIGLSQMNPFSALPSDPAPSILQFSLSSSCVSSSLTSGTENLPISTTDHPVDQSSLSASQNSPSASLGPCLSPGCLSLSSSPNPVYRLSPSDF